MIQPYLFFEGRCEEAIAFYCETLGAEVDMVMRFSESPDPLPPGAIPEGSEDRIMHAAFRIGDAIVMASDGNCTGEPRFGGFSLSLTTESEADADRLFSALAEGGEIQMPIGKTFWSPRFGMVKDRFGVSWMITVAEEGGGS